MEKKHALVGSRDERGQCAHLVWRPRSPSLLVQHRPLICCRHADPQRCRQASLWTSARPVDVRARAVAVLAQGRCVGRWGKEEALEERLDVELLRALEAVCRGGKDGGADLRGASGEHARARGEGLGGERTQTTSSTTRLTHSFASLRCSLRCTSLSPCVRSGETRRTSARCPDASARRTAMKVRESKSAAWGVSRACRSARSCGRAGICAPRCSSCARAAVSPGATLSAPLSPLLSIPASASTRTEMAKKAANKGKQPVDTPSPLPEDSGASSRRRPRPRRTRAHHRN